jgi:hypothetical protein
LIENPRIYDLIKEYGFTAVFLGRETPNGESASLLGRRYRGIIRDQERLDKEEKAIEELLSVKGLNVVLGYILSPFDTIEQATQLINETISLTDKGAEVRIRGLVPYPGTEIRRSHLSDLVNPSEWLISKDLIYPALTWKNSRFKKLFSFLNSFCRDDYFRPEDLQVIRKELKSFY